MDSTAIIVAIVGATVSLTAARWGLQHSKKVDAISAQSGVASNHRAGTQQLIEGLNALVDQHQDDLKEARGTIKESREIVQLLEGRIASVTAERDGYRFERDASRAELARLRKKYMDNGDTPQPPNK